MNPVLDHPLQFIIGLFLLPGQLACRRLARRPRAEHVITLP